MSRNLVLLNLALLALLVAFTTGLYRRTKDARQRYDIFERTGSGQGTPAFSRPAKPAAIRPSDYLAVVDRLLFSKDRNPIVTVEVPLPEVAARPDLPRFIGLMDLGEGPIALLASDSKAIPKAVARGEKVGEFTFVEAHEDSITFQWQDETIEVSQAELKGSPVQAAGTSLTPRRAAAGRPQPGSSARLDPQREGRVGGRHNIGPELAGRPGVYAADPKDTSTHGTEHEGFVKTVKKTPFGTQSWWVKKQQEQK